VCQYVQGIETTERIVSVFTGHGLKSGGKIAAH
jgi:hypothetical protein